MYSQAVFTCHFFKITQSFIVIAIIINRTTIRSGMDVTEALALSDAYIQRCELASEESTIRNLNYLMVIDYAEKVHKIRFGQNSSKLVLSVSKYIQQHLSDPIKVQDLADALYMGRSRLSTNFKKETGINLSDYITMNKIDEAKRLLHYSDKSITSIAGYLGFANQSHFTKVFRQYANHTPLEYRQLHKR